jgi:colanic acid biosynthesis glycosyl transferase WcaI
MHILIISQYFWPENFRINDIAHGLLEKGYKVTVLTGMPNYPSGKIFDGYKLFAPKFEKYGSIDIFRVPIVPRGSGRGMRLFLNYLSFVLSGVLFGLFYCRKLKIDSIFVFEVSPITQAIPALVFKWFKKSPVVLYILDLWPDTLFATKVVRSRVGQYFAKMITHFIHRRCDTILVQSRAFIDRLIAQKVAQNKISYWPSYPEAIYHDRAVSLSAAEQSMLPNGFVIMFAGNVGESQDFPAILDVAEKLNDYADIHFVILGDGRLLPWVKNQVLIRKLEHNVHLLGRHPLEKMPAFFEYADVMLVSLRDEPVFDLTIPAKIQSYMACGKSIVAALNGEGNRIVNESQSGFAVPAGDVDLLMQAILKAYKMPKEELAAMGALGRAYCDKNFCRAKLLTQLDELFKSMLQVDV